MPPRSASPRRAPSILKALLGSRRAASTIEYGLILAFIVLMMFGALMNLYSWPFSAGVGGLGWQPGSSLSQTLQQYWLFYLTTSLTWDTLRGCSTAAFILVLARPLLRELRRFRRRFVWTDRPMTN